MRLAPLLVSAFALLGGACVERASLPLAAGTGRDPALPPPRVGLLPTVDIAPARGWPEDAAPQAADGLVVRPFARRLEHPRWLYVLPNGDVLVAETNGPAPDSGGLRTWIMQQVKKRTGSAVPSADRIALLRDGDGDGTPETRSIFLDGLHSPFGMALVGGDFYVANTDALWRFPYEEGQTRLAADSGEQLSALPAGPINRHWTRNLIAARDGRGLYVAVGSSSDHGEHGMGHEVRRAAILGVELPAGRTRLVASGLRNPVGMDFEPETGVLWTVVNERDELGSDLVPDYLTAVEDGGFYGWPFSYFGRHPDPRVEPARPDLVATAIAPDYALGPHTASLGLAFQRGGQLAGRYPNGAFVGQHGSWNRRPPSGYKVVFVPFSSGRPSGAPQDVITGFVNERGEALGRPVGVAFDATGALLVADDVGNTVWRVTPPH
jgi:glucose/arabinose dehydrogenase